MRVDSGLMGNLLLHPKAFDRIGPAEVRWYCGTCRRWFASPDARAVRDLEGHREAHATLVPKPAAPQRKRPTT